MSTQVQQDWGDRVRRLRYQLETWISLIQKLDTDDECSMSGADVVEFVCNMRLGMSEAFETVHDPLLDAAPELLEACRSCLHQIGTDSDLDDVVSRPDKYDELEQMLRDVIDKAAAH
jgi:hypothetical protein